MKHKFFTVSPLKFALLSVLTLTLFNIYWFYKNLSVFKKNNPKKGSRFPVIEAIFSPLFSCRCFKNISQTALELGVNNKAFVTILAFIYFLFFAVGVGNDNPFLTLVRLLAFIAILPMNNLAMKVNEKLS